MKASARIKEKRASVFHLSTYQSRFRAVAVRGTSVYFYKKPRNLLIYGRYIGEAIFCPHYLNN